MEGRCHSTARGVSLARRAQRPTFNLHLDGVRTIRAGLKTISRPALNHVTTCPGYSHRRVQNSRSDVDRSIDVARLSGDCVCRKDKKIARASCYDRYNVMVIIYSCQLRELGCHKTRNLPPGKLRTLAHPPSSEPDEGVAGSAAWKVGMTGACANTPA